MRRLAASLRLVAAALAVGLAAPAWAGPAMESETQAVLRSAVLGGGDDDQALSTNYRLIPYLGEEVASSTEPFSGTSRLGAGLAHVAHFPGRVTDLAERGDASVSSMTLTWTTPGYDGAVGPLQAGTTYFIRVASFTAGGGFTDHRLANVSFSTSGMSPGQLASRGVTGLQPNTTYWARLWTVDAAGNLSYASPVSTMVTLALPVTLQPESFVEVMYTSVTAHWVARPSSPPDASSMTAAGYLLETSSTNFGALAPGGAVSSSATDKVALSTLTVSFPGLIVDRTYYFRVGALNWAGVPNWTSLGSTDTKFQVNDPIPADPTFTGLSTGALRVNWDRNGNPANAFYYARVSTAVDFTGVTTTTDTFNLFYSTGGLNPNTTYHFAVQATTRSQSSAWAFIGSTMTWSLPPAVAGVPLPAVHASSLTVRWLHNGNPPGQSTYTVVATTSQAYPNEDDGRVIVASTRPAGADPVATFTGLAPNTTYHLFAAAHNHAGAQGEWVLLASTASRPAPPAFAGFEVVSYSSASASWSTNGNPLGVTTYTATLSTVAAHPPTGAWDVAITTLPDSSPVVLEFPGLQLNVTYYLHVDAVGHAHRAFTVGPSSATRAAVPQPETPDYSPVAETSLTVNWTAGAADPGFNAAAPLTEYLAVLSANAGFSPALASSRTFNLSAGLTGLSVNTTYYSRVAAYSHHHGTWTAYADLPSTATLAALPVAGAPTFVRVFFSSAIVSWGANGNPVDVTSYVVAFTSGYVYPNALPDNVEFTTAPAGATPSATIDTLNSNTTYTFFVRALSHAGAATAFVNLGSTRTLNSPKTWVGGVDASWHTAGNWSPSGVPGFTDAVTIAANASVTAFAPAISFSSLTLGSGAGTAVANLHLATTVASGGSVRVNKSAGLTQATTRQLLFDGDFTMLSGSSLTHAAATAVSVSSVNIRVTGTFDLQAGATINVVGRGFPGGAVDTAGSGPGAGGTDTANNEGGGGGGYGGAGGNGVGAPGGVGGGVYGSLTAPIHLGSGGGGSGNTGVGGAGGGIVILDAGVMKLDGIILSSGGAGQSVPTGSNLAGGGGGSGGGVYITAVSLTGGGTVNVSGGPGGIDDVGPGGGGGGGRVAVVVSGGGVACGLTVTTAGGAAGGAGATAGAAGTFHDGAGLAAPAGLAGTALSDSSVQWDWSLTTGATDYQLFSSTGGPMSPALGAAVTYVTSGLTPNATASFYVQARACGANLASSAAEDESTFARTPVAAADSFTGAARLNLNVAWDANGNPLLKTTYTVVLSTGAAYPNTHEGNVSLSTLPAGATLDATGAGLYPNTTYFLHVAAVNHAGIETAYASLGATSTLSDAPLALTYFGTFLSVQATSVTLAWAAMPPSPPEASSRTSQGYILEVSSTNFGALSPGGVVNSSLTFAVAASTLTVDYPDAAETTNYYRVTSLNWNGARGDTLVLGKMNFSIAPSAVLLDLGAIDMTVAVATVSVSSFVVRNSGDLPATYVVDADTNTPGSPWILGTAPGNDVVALQGLWNTGPPGPPHAAFSTAITSHGRVSSGAAYAGDQTGVSVPPGQSRTLWFRLRIPASTTSNAAEQLRVSVTPVFP